MQNSPRSIGDDLRKWREHRGLSQLELSLRAEVSARHLSFVETGRSLPGRDLVLRLSEELEIPLRERNTLLLAAGFAPPVPQRGFDDPAFDSVRDIIDMTLNAHKPFPAHAIDRYWNVIATNNAIPESYEGVADELRRPPINIIRLTLHPQGLAPRIVNLAEWRAHLLARLRRQVYLTADPTLEHLLREASSYPAPAYEESMHAASDRVAVPLEITTSIGRLSFLTATTVFGTPLDATLDEIALELLYPANLLTAEAIRRAADKREKSKQRISA